MASGTIETMSISGSGFESGATVTFEDESGPEPTGSVTSVSASLIIVEIDAKSGGPNRDRFWDVRVTNPDDSTDVLQDGLKITP